MAIKYRIVTQINDLGAILYLPQKQVDIGSIYHWQDMKNKSENHFTTMQSAQDFIELRRSIDEFVSAVVWEG